MPVRLPTALTIAGSDSGGGAGIQADLLAFRENGAHGTSAISAITAQNPTVVELIDPVSVCLLQAQVEAVCAGFDVAAVKTGMLPSDDAVRSVASCHRALMPAVPLVVDPVLRASSGRALQASSRAVWLTLLSQATLVTPNVAEAAWLCDLPVETPTEELARQSAATLGCAVLLTGGHRSDAPGEDLLVGAGVEHVFAAQTWQVDEIHGSGCLLSAAITAHLAHGLDLVGAIERSRRWLASQLCPPAFVSGHAVPRPADGLAGDDWA